MIILNLNKTLDILKFNEIKNLDIIQSYMIDYSVNYHI